MKKYVSTGSDVIDNLLDGGWPTRATSGVFAGPDIGKSFLFMQTANHLWEKEGLGTIYIDTESHYVREKTKNRFYSFFQDRWNFDDKPDIKYVFPDDLNELAEYLGKDISLVSEKGAKKIKIFINNIASKYDCQLAQDLEDGDYGMVVLDSLTKAVADEIPAPPRQNFPTRKSAEDSLLGRLTPLAKKYNLATVVSIHQTKDPAQGHYDTGTPVGGRGVKYHLKYVLQMKGKPQKEKRTVSHYRYPGKKSARTKKEGEEVTLAEDKGFVP